MSNAVCCLQKCELTNPIPWIKMRIGNTFLFNKLSVYNQNTMLKILESILKQKCLIERTKSVLLGVSGGVDSICLLDLFYRLGYPVVVAHFHHGIRVDSNQDAQFVEKTTNLYGVPFVLGQESVPEYAQEHNLSIEEAGRIIRYQFLFAEAEKRGCQAVAVAHNTDDQVETILMHLLRGTGMQGLKGMTYYTLPNSWSESIPLIRPLLSSWRSDIENYCLANGLEYILDLSNLDTNLFRNRLRHEIIPELETISPGFRKRLYQTADLIHEDIKILNEVVEKTWTTAVRRKGEGYIAFGMDDFDQLTLGLRRRIVLKAIEILRSSARDVDYTIVHRVLAFVGIPTQTHQADIGLGLRVLLEEDLLIIAACDAELFTDDWPQIVEDAVLQMPGILILEGGWILQVELVADPEAISAHAHHNPNPYHAWMALDKDQDQIVIRKRKPGDVFKPLGMGGKKMKLSDFMINLKIPYRARANWPLVCVEDEIAWVPGYRLAHPFRLREAKADRVISLKAIRA